MCHYSDKDGYNAIASQVIWRFAASQPPGNHPFGAYFTPHPPQTPNLARKLGIPRSKLAWMSEFVDIGDLLPLPGGRGEHIRYSPSDYEVSKTRQLNRGETEL